MPRADVPAVIANTINETARGDPDDLAARIVAALGEAGYRIVPTNGIGDTARGSQPDNHGIAQLYRSENGDTWFLALGHFISNADEAMIATALEAGRAIRDDKRAERRPTLRVVT